MGLAAIAIRARSASRTSYRLAWGLAVLSTLLLLAGEAKADLPPPKEAEQAPPAQPPLPEVVVRAQREALERGVRAFVSSSVREPFDDSLARWSRNNPICPLAVGLSRQDEELLRARLSEIVAAAGAPLAPQPCKANFAVIVTAEPDAVLKGWYRRDSHLFGDDTTELQASENQIKEWIELPRAARVWYNIKSESASGLPFQRVCFAGHCVVLDPTAEASHLVFNSVRVFSSVIVAIDVGRAKEINLKQIGDYAAMVGLAEIHLDADLGEAPTILRLFSASQGTKPAGLSDWDAAFLKALYHTSQDAKLQRSAITQSIIHDIAP